MPKKIIQLTPQTKAPFKTLVRVNPKTAGPSAALSVRPNPTKPPDAAARNMLAGKKK